jgi:hypothetical protein
MMTCPRITRTRLRAVAVPAAVAFGALVALAPAAQAGMIDGSLNNLHTLDHSNILGVMAMSAITDGSNSNANTRAAGKINNSVHMQAADTAASAQSCTLTVTARDPDGAWGRATVAVPEGTAGTVIRIPDESPVAVYGVGDTDHLAGDIVCTDTATGAVTALLDVTTDLVAH